MEPKKPWQSKTIVVNAVLGLVGAVALFVPGADSLRVLISNHAPEIAMGWSILNIILRAVTHGSIELGE